MRWSLLKTWRKKAKFFRLSGDNSFWITKHLGKQVLAPLLGSCSWNSGMWCTQCSWPRFCWRRGPAPTDLMRHIGGRPFLEARTQSGRGVWHRGGVARDSVITPAWGRYSCSYLCGWSHRCTLDTWRKPADLLCFGASRWCRPILGYSRRLTDHKSKRLFEWVILV